MTRKFPQDIAREYMIEHPEKFQSEVVRELGITRGAAYRAWKSLEKPKAVKPREKTNLILACYRAGHDTMDELHELTGCSRDLIRKVGIANGLKIKTRVQVREENVLVYIYTHPNCTATIIAEDLGYTVRMVKTSIQRLSEKGLL